VASAVDVGGSAIRGIWPDQLAGTQNKDHPSSLAAAVICWQATCKALFRAAKV
jgi:hypothetical protein